MMGLGLAELLILGFMCVLFFVGILATVIGLLVYGSRHRSPDPRREPPAERPAPRTYTRGDAPPSRRAPDDHDSRLDLVTRITRRFCPRCRAALADDSPQGLCPACLLSEGIESESAPGAVDGAAVTTPPSGSHPPLTGEIDDLQPNFPTLEILELLGRGGMGAVYKARQKNLDRLVALKVIPPEAAKDPTFTERFNREARALARLNHPNIVTVYDFGQAGNIYYLLMEYIDGVNLRQAQRAQRLEPSEALAIVPQICDALQYAHDQGVVHRDIKPENVLLDRSGRVKIADFGLAKLIGRGVDDFTLTGTQQVMGTPRYMAPEQIERPSAVDHRADIYSLGVVIYEMLTGELPVGRFPAPSERVEVDVRIDQVVLRTLEKEPERRYQRASQVKTELASATGEIPAAPVAPRAMPTSQFPPSSPPAKPSVEDEFTFAGGAQVAVAAALGLGLLLFAAGAAGIAGYFIAPTAIPTQIGWDWVAGSIAFWTAGIGLFVGSAMSYRQLPHSTDLLRVARMTWLDWLLVSLAMLGVVLVLVQISAWQDSALVFAGIPGLVALALAGLGFAVRRLLWGAGSYSPFQQKPTTCQPSFVMAVGLPTVLMAGVFVLLWLDVALSHGPYDPEVGGPVYHSEVYFSSWKRVVILSALIVVPMVFASLSAWWACGARMMSAEGDCRVVAPFSARGWLVAIGGLGLLTLLLPWMRLQVLPQSVVVFDLRAVFPREPSPELMVNPILREGSLRSLALMPGGWRFAHRGATLETGVLFAVFYGALLFVGLLHQVQFRPWQNGLAVGCGLVGLALVLSQVHRAADRDPQLLVDTLTLRGLEKFARDSRGQQPTSVAAWAAPASQAFEATPGPGMIVAWVACGLAFLAGVTRATWSASAPEAIPVWPRAPASPAVAASIVPNDKLQSRVQSPAVGLMVIGALGILLALLGACVAAALVPVRTEIRPGHAAAAANWLVGRESFRDSSGLALRLLAQQGAPQVQSSNSYAFFTAGLGALFVLAINLPVSVLILIAGWRMRRLQSYGLAVTASILSILPCTLVWVIALPIGIWSLVVLTRPEVREAFAS